MKKIICSALLGSFIGVAFGLPTPEDRKAFCEKHPDKYVWVQKTEACVPINPCLSDNFKIKHLYCVEMPILWHRKLLETYISYNLNTTISSFEEIGGYYAVKLNDGGYIVFLPNKAFEGNNVAEEIIYGSFWAYGKYETAQFLDKNVIFSKQIDSKEMCSEIADIATLGNGSVCTYDYGNLTCVIHCETFVRENSEIRKY